jgi:subtilisin family serine protease
MSLSANGTAPQFVAPVRNAVAADTVVVGSIGNTEAGTSGSPGNVFETVSVGATDVDENVAPFSAGETIVTPVDWGPLAPPEWPATYVVPDVSAPGVAVLSTRSGGGYVTFQGTSMAAPHVSGTLALMHAAAPGDPSVEDLRTALYETARKPAGAPPGQDIRYGRGIVNALDATRQVATPDCIPGDANRDGQVTALDATLVQRAVVGLPVPGEFDAACADASGDGRLSALDATVILRTVAGLPTTSPRITGQNG